MASNTYKRILNNHPFVGKNGQYVFPDDVDGNDDYIYRDHSASLSLPPYTDKFTDKDLYTTVKEIPLNNTIIDYGLAYPSPAQIRINKIHISNNGVTGDINNVKIKCYMFDNFAYENSRDEAAGGSPLTDSYSDFKHRACWTKFKFFDDHVFGGIDEGGSPGTIMKDVVLVNNIDEIKEDMSIGSFPNDNTGTDDSDFDIAKAFQAPIGGSDGTNLFSSAGGQKIYIVIQMEGDHARWYTTDDRKRQYQIYEFDVQDLFNDDGTGKLTEGELLDFDYNSTSRKLEGDGGSGGWSSEKPAFRCSTLSLSINTIPGLTDEDIEDLPNFIREIIPSVQQAKFISPNKFDETFFYIKNEANQSPYREVRNLIPGQNENIYIDDTLLTGFNKLNAVKADFNPVSVVKILNNDNYDLQTYQTDAISKQICSAPNQVSLDFYLSKKTFYKSATWGGVKETLNKNETTFWFEEDINTLDCTLLPSIEWPPGYEGRVNAYITMDVFLNATDTSTLIHYLVLSVGDIGTGQNNGSKASQGFRKYIQPANINEGDGWKLNEWNSIKLKCWDNSDGANVYYYDENYNTVGDYYHGKAFSKIQIYKTGGPSTNSTDYIEIKNFKIEPNVQGTPEDENILEDDTQVILHPSNGVYGWAGFKYFVIDWDDKDDKFIEPDDFLDDFPLDYEELNSKREKNLYIFSDLDELGTENISKNPLIHTYQTPGIKTIKSIVFSHTQVPERATNRGHVQTLRWKFVTTRIFLDIPVSQYPDFGELGGADFNTLPWPYTTPVIGGVSENSKYNISVKNTLAGGNIGNSDIIDETFLENSKENDEIGKTITNFDFAQTRYFNNGIYDMGKLLGISQDLFMNTTEEYLATLPFPYYKEEFDVTDDFDEFLGDINPSDLVIWSAAGRPDIFYYLISLGTSGWNNIPEAGDNNYNEPSYFFNPSYGGTSYIPYYYLDHWDCRNWNSDRNYCFSDETSVGEIFIGDNSDLNLRNNCKLELNANDLDGKIIHDSSGGGNKGMLIGDYKIKKNQKNKLMNRDSFIKIPKKGYEDGAL